MVVTATIGGVVGVSVVVVAFVSDVVEVAAMIGGVVGVSVVVGAGPTIVDVMATGIVVLVVLGGFVGDVGTGSVVGAPMLVVDAPVVADDGTDTMGRSGVEVGRAADGDVDVVVDPTFVPAVPPTTAIVVGGAVVALGALDALVATLVADTPLTGVAPTNANEAGRVGRGSGREGLATTVLSAWAS